MNVHFEQVNRKSQVVSYLLATFAIFLALLVLMNLVRHVELHWSISSASVQTTSIENSDMPVAIPVHLLPVEQSQSIATPEPDGKPVLVLTHQAIPAPAPSAP